MEKPEWFKDADADASVPSSSKPENARFRASSFAKRLVAVGAAALIAGGGVAFAASSLTGANAETNTPPAASETTSPTATATPTPTPTGTTTTPPTTPAPNGTQPTVSIGQSGDDETDADDQGENADDQGENGGGVDVNAQVGVNGQGDD